MCALVDALTDKLRHIDDALVRHDNQPTYPGWGGFCPVRNHKIDRESGCETPYYSACKKACPIGGRDLDNASEEAQHDHKK